MLKIFFASIAKAIHAALLPDHISVAIGTGVAVLGTIFSYLLGDFDYAILMLFGFIILDYITGFLASVKNKTVSSDVMYWGIIRKISQLVIIGIGVAVDRLIGNNTFVVRLMIIYYYIGMEGISILENLGLLGVPFPKKLIDILEQIRKEDVSNAQIRDETNSQLVDFSVKKKVKSQNKDSEV